MSSWRVLRVNEDARRRVHRSKLALCDFSRSKHVSNTEITVPISPIGDRSARSRTGTLKFIPVQAHLDSIPGQEKEKNKASRKKVGLHRQPLRNKIKIDQRTSGSQ
jgi:hypothetical protein